MIEQVEQSLRRLQTDRIDLYYAHFPDPNTPLEQTLAAYDDLIRQGKIRYAALSNHPAWQVTHALWIAEDRRLVSAPVAAQVKYSLLDRSAESELAPACAEFRGRGRRRARGRSPCPRMGAPDAAGISRMAAVASRCGLGDRGCGDHRGTPR